MVVYNPNSKIDRPATNDDYSANLNHELLNVWGREVVVQYVDKDQPECFGEVWSLLASRKIFGSTEDERIVKLQSTARKIVENGITLFEGIAKRIQETRALVLGKDFEVTQMPILSGLGC